MRPLTLPRAHTLPAAVLLLTALLTPGATPSLDLVIDATVSPVPAPRACLPRPAAPPSAAPAAGAATVVTLTVAPRSRLRLAVDGSPVAAATNTGRAPCATDVWTVEPGGRPAAQPVVDAVLAGLAATGQDGEAWEPGTWTTLARA